MGTHQKAGNSLHQNDCKAGAEGQQGHVCGQVSTCLEKDHLLQSVQMESDVCEKLPTNPEDNLSGLSKSKQLHLDSDSHLKLKYLHPTRKKNVVFLWEKKANSMFHQ